MNIVRMLSRDVTDDPLKVTNMPTLTSQQKKKAHASQKAKDLFTPNRKREANLWNSAQARKHASETFTLT